MSELAQRIESARRMYVAAMGTAGEDAAKAELERRIEAAKQQTKERQ